METSRDWRKQRDNPPLAKHCWQLSMAIASPALGAVSALAQDATHDVNQQQCKRCNWSRVQRMRGHSGRLPFPLRR